MSMFESSSTKKSPPPDPRDSAGEHELRRELPEPPDLPRCAWCGLPIRFNPLAVDDDKGRLQVYHEDCYRYGLTLDPEKIGWTPSPRGSQTSSSR